MDICVELLSAICADFSTYRRDAAYNLSRCCTCTCGSDPNDEEEEDEEEVGGGPNAERQPLFRDQSSMGERMSLAREPQSTPGMQYGALSTLDPLAPSVGVVSGTDESLTTV